MSNHYKFEEKTTKSRLKSNGLIVLMVIAGVAGIRALSVEVAPDDVRAGQDTVVPKAHSPAPSTASGTPEAVKPYLDKGYSAELLDVKDGVMEYKLQKEDDVKLFYVLQAFPTQGFLGFKTDSSGQVVIPELQPSSEEQATQQPEEGGLGVHALTLSSIDMAPPATQAFEDAGKYLAYIPMGNVNLPPVYYFADPDCPNCMKAWGVLLPFLLEGKVHLRVLPSGARVAPDWYTMTIDEIIESVLPPQLGGKAVQPKANQLDKAKTYVQDIEAFLDDYNIQGYPAFIFRGPDGTPVILQGYSDRLVDALGLRQ